MAKINNKKTLKPTEWRSPFCGFVDLGGGGVRTGLIFSHFLS